MQRRRSGEEKIHIATLDVRNYRPDEVSLRVEGDILVVKAKHYADGSFGFERNELQRTYPVPQDADPASITSKISQDGYLTIPCYCKAQCKHICHREEIRSQGRRVECWP